MTVLRYCPSFGPPFGPCPRPAASSALNPDRHFPRRPRARLWILGLALAVLLPLGSPALAQPAHTRLPSPPGVGPTADRLPGDRPRIALVLSGGGARGLAHIGVLKVLESLQVPVDLVVGTSMGAVVGGAYAAGRSPHDLEVLMRGADWDNILADRPPRDELSFRRREDDRLLASRVEFGLTSQGVRLPNAAAGNSGLEFTLQRLPPAASHDTQVDQLPLPFRAVATDLLSGQMVVLSDLPLRQAIRASMAVPGLFTPVRLQGRLLVDGALVRNLPIDVARQMGADLIIAVDVGSPLLAESEIQSALGVADQMLKILTSQNVERSLAELRPQDILIRPALQGIGLTDFQRSDQALEDGIAAARQVADRLRALAVDDAAYRRHEAAREQLRQRDLQATPVLTAVTLAGTETDRVDSLRRALPLEPGEPASLQQVQQAAAQLYGRGDFERVETRIEDRDGGRQVGFELTDALWTRSRVRLGVEVASQFERATEYTLSGMHTLSWLNAWGAELRTVAKLGFTRQLQSSWFQPLGPGSRWYLEPSVGLSGATLNFERQLVPMQVHKGSLTLGRQLGDWGTLELGAGRKRTRLELQGSANLFNERFDFARLRVDTLDAMAFPTSGRLLDLRYLRNFSRDGTVTVSVDAKGMQAFHLGDWAGHAYVNLADVPRGSPLYTQEVLGGFLRLSGLAPQAYDRVKAHAFTRLVMARKIGDMPTGLGGALRGGFSIEAARQVPWPGDEVQVKLGLQAPRTPWSTQAGSVFLSVDTRFGPVYVAHGAVRGGGQATYFFIGPVW